MLTGKVCIVTGGSRGIGKAVSQEFAKNGAIVYATATREGSIESWSEAFNKDCAGSVRSLYFDVTDEPACAAAVMKVKKENGHIDALVNNAGVEFNELIGMINREHIQKMFDVNVCGTINKIGRAHV